MGAASRRPTSMCPLAPQSTEVGVTYYFNTAARRACMLYHFGRVRLFATPCPIACH